MITHKKIFWFLFAAFFFPGCATIVSGSTQMISVRSNVDGAKVFLDDTYLGETPLVAHIEKGLDGPIIVKARGYRTEKLAINKAVTGAFWGNIILGGLFGSSTDNSTGAMYEYRPDSFFIELRPSDHSEEDTERCLKIANLRRFVLMNHEPIIRQLAMGDGTHLETLYGALKIEESQRARFLATWREAYQESDTVVGFANRFVAKAPL